MSNPFLDPDELVLTPKVEPVRVIETIPIAHENHIGEEARESIPSPTNLSVLPELARGGMGHIHPAVDRNLLRQVVLKRLNVQFAATPMYRDGFIAEAQIQGQLEHPNIAPVHELAIDPQGNPYFTMKYVQGISFDVWLRHHPRGNPERLAEGIEVLLKVCDALAYAHHRGVLHRDIKPGNVMVGDFGQVYLMDWGLARLVRSEQHTGAYAMMNAIGPVGTPNYMAPEQARGNPLECDERADVFGLGALLFEVLSGQFVYGNGSVEELLERAAQGRVLSVDAACKDLGIAPRIRAIAERATHPEPAQRYQTILALQEDLRAFLHGGMHLPQKTFPAGHEIFREGDRGDEAYMIVAGNCRAHRIVDGQDETLSIMGIGETFGEMALLLFEPRAATVTAMSNVTVLVLDKATMSDGLGLSGWTGSLVRALAQRFADLEQVVRTSGIRRS
jgi:eukaryotic-like serine/threonine-protein kinase